MKLSDSGGAGGRSCWPQVRSPIFAYPLSIVDSKYRMNVCLLRVARWTQPKQPEGLGTPNMERLMAKVEEPTPMVNPPESVMDRIHFVINNVTASNLSSKVKLC